MTRKKPLLSMIHHGTDGSDGIEPGIHLRWVFHAKMGFPPGGFVLWRRKSDRKKLVCLDINSFKENSINLPYKYLSSIFRRLAMIISSESRNSFQIEEVEISSGTRIKLLQVLDSANIGIRPSVSNIEIDYYVTKGAKFSVIAKSGESVVWQKEITGLQNELIHLKIMSFAVDNISIVGKVVYIAKVCCWVCGERGIYEWEPVNEKCGYGLPFDQKERSSYIQKNYQGVCDTDWTIASCRLGPQKVCAFKGKNFDEFKSILAKMNGDGVSVPVGWNLMALDNESQSCRDDKSGKAGLKLSPYDVMLMQSQNPDIARILGLYWVDNEIADDEYYDYKITASWPSRHRTLWRLKHELTFDHEYVSHFNFPIMHYGCVVFRGSTINSLGRIIAYQSRIARVDRGLSFNYPHESAINAYFTSPVREFQIFLSQLGLMTEIEAYVDIFGQPVDKGILIHREGILTVHYHEPIRMIRIKGKGVIVLRIHYDAEYIPYGQQKFIICGVKKEKPVPLAIPTGLEAVCLRGRVSETKEDCSVVDHRFNAGLRWDIPVNSNESILLSNSPISYHVLRTTPRNEEIFVTKDNPVHVVPDDLSFQEVTELPQQETGLPGCREGERIQERQNFFDAVDEKGKYGYQVVAVDIFGRVSEFSDKAEVLLSLPMPPPPANVNAKYIDCLTYDPQTDKSSDPNINQNEKLWLKTHPNKSAIVVRWNWSPNQQRQSPEVLGFHIYLKHGWLNLIQGDIVAVHEQAMGDRITANINWMNEIDENTLAGEWMRQGKRIYKIFGNSRFVPGNPRISIKVEFPPKYLKIPPDEIHPIVNEIFVIPLTKLNGAALDYKKCQNWRPYLRELTIVVPSQEKYEIYISDPLFPNPPFKPDKPDNQGYEADKTRYAQIGVSAFSEEGEGSVSQPSTIIAIDRRKPPAQVFADSPGLKATPADFYGKSTFPLRWLKSTDPGIKFFVYRAMDETIFSIDWSFRPRTAIVPTQGKVFPPEWGNDQRQQICNELNVLNDFTHDDIGKALAMKCYKELSNDAFRVLASLDGNEDSFAKLNDKPIGKDEPIFQDRDTNVPDPGSAPQPGNPNTLLYLDETLDGRGDNLYFYRIRPIDEIGNLGAFGLATVPVGIPKVTPPQPPVITQISGGDRQITIKWAGNPGSNIKGYLLYRTDDEQKAKDIRKMNSIKTNLEDEYTVEVIDPAQLAFEYADMDQSIVPKRPYYYRLVAVCEGETAEQKLLSMASAIKVGQSVDTHIPPPPVWKLAQWVLINEADGSVELWPDDGDIPAGRTPTIRLEWSSNVVAAKFKILRRLRGEYGWSPVAGEGDYLQLSATEAVFMDSNVSPDKNYSYRIRVFSQTGVPSIDFREIELGKPSRLSE